MQYLGGKSRLAKHIAPVLTAAWRPGMAYYEPFVGAGSVLVAMAKALPPDTPMFASDIHEDLILMWQALQQGWTPPTELDEPTYQRLKQEQPSALRGFAGFGCSFGGKWWGGYAKNSRKDRYAEQSANSLRLKAVDVHLVKFSHSNYAHLTPSNAVVYCDPPYDNRTGYRDTFDHTAFWSTVRQWSATNTVLVSEYSAPPDFKPIAEFHRNQELRTGGIVRERVVDKLFQYAP